VGDLLVSFTKDQNVLDEALPDALYYSGIYGEGGHVGGSGKGDHPS
jgi:hypothetical protein